MLKDCWRPGAALWQWATSPPFHVQRAASSTASNRCSQVNCQTVLHLTHQSVKASGAQSGLSDLLDIRTRFHRKFNRRNYVKAIRYLLAPFLLVATTGGVCAQSTVESRVEKLEETTRILDRRIAVLEGQLRERSAPAPLASEKVKWRKLQMGMSEGDVENLLGSPSRVDAFGSFTVWHYGDLSGGKVQFDGRGRTVSGWNEPR